MPEVFKFQKSLLNKWWIYPFPCSENSTERESSVNGGCLNAFQGLDSKSNRPAPWMEDAVCFQIGLCPHGRVTSNLRTLFPSWPTHIQSSCLHRHHDSLFRPSLTLYAYIACYGNFVVSLNASMLRWTCSSAMCSFQRDRGNVQLANKALIMETKPFMSWVPESVNQHAKKIRQ